ncbi:MAG TPA: 16S rRNA (cytosine(967)-C(5))-methyltransferase RsmB [Steroidobacteraceae bacterium]|nr:16S rRNA (cytosine(967)-C(5))-methyltransferase RsmB [Steroidobacteraceae bacterium]
MARTPWAPGAPALAAAARAVEAVVSRGASADAALGADAGSDRAAVQAITLGTLRWYLRLAPAVESLLKHPPGVAAGVRALLVVGAHQVEYSRNVPELTVHAAVDAARLLGAERATGLVNAVLRRFAAARAELLGRSDSDLASRTAHPAWLVGRLQAAWPDQVASILDANNAHPPLVLRIDLSRATVRDVQASLREKDIESHAIQWMPSALVLDRPVGVSDLPGFTEGLLSVQDAGAQLAPRFLGIHPGLRVLDACAAPGGKTGHLLESAGGDLDLTALDVEAGRVALIGENLARLRRPARLLAGDARDPQTFWDGRPFDRILVDAPCTSTGVIRRHPDVKLLRRPADAKSFAATQLAILRAAVLLLARGGRLLYATCSVLPQENEQVVNDLLTLEPTLSPADLPDGPPGALARSPGLQLLPGAEAGTDGFYYACLEKTTA